MPLLRLAHVTVACAAAACVEPPRVIDVVARTTPEASADIAELHVRVASRDVTRCQAFTESPIALPLDRADLGDRVVVTAVDGDGAPVAVGSAEVDGDEVAVALTPVERRLPRTAAPGLYLADGNRSAGRQLAMTAGGRAAIVWTDRPHEYRVLGRAWNGPPGALDRGLVPSQDPQRDLPVVAAVGEHVVAAWSVASRAIRVHGLDAGLEPLAPFGDLPIAEVGEDGRAITPTLVGVGDRVLAMWVEAARGRVSGRIGTRWLDARATPVTTAAYLADDDRFQHTPAAIGLASGAAVLGWVEDASATGARPLVLRLARIGRDAGPELASAVTVDAAGIEVATVAMAAVGDRVAVAWNTVSGAPHLAFFDAALGMIGSPIDLAHHHPVQQVALVAHGGGLLLAWTEEAPSQVHTAWVRWLAADGSSASDPRLAGLIAGGDQRFVSIASAGGQAVIAWQQTAAPDRDGGIVGRPIAPDDTTAAPAPCNAPGAP